jgi:hypothetical protein
MLLQFNIQNIKIAKFNDNINLVSRLVPSCNTPDRNTPLEVAHRLQLCRQLFVRIEVGLPMKASKGT